MSLAETGQDPKAMLIGCIDSRVDPAVIFDAAPGEILTVRNVANLVPPYLPDAAYHGTSAALEFGVKVLQVPHLIVLGHGMCGGVKALLEGDPLDKTEFVDPWMSIAEPARIRALAAPAEDRQRHCELGVIEVSLRNLMTFPWIAQRVAERKLNLHGAWFDIRIGELAILGADGSFQRA
jgi:carbonic anhydrase